MYEQSKNKTNLSWNPEYNATNNCTNSNISLYHKLVVVAVPKICIYLFDDEKYERKKRDPFLGNEILPCPFAHLSQKRESLSDGFIEFVGTDGARTRSFRLDRAVL